MFEIRVIVKIRWNSDQDPKKSVSMNLVDGGELK